MRDKPLISDVIGRTVLGILGLVFALAIAKFCGLKLQPSDEVLVDFDIVHIVGGLIWQGRLVEAYHAADFMKVQQALGSDTFAPWPYPPPFDLIAAALGLLPLPVAFALYAGGTLIALLWVLRRLSGEQFPFVLLAAFPAVAMNLNCGQNGFLTATLIGVTCLWLQEGRGRPGVPLGLMVIKPHLVVPLAVAVIARLDWRTARTAALTVAAACAVSTLAFGFAVWPAFLDGMAEAQQFLRDGLYPFYRMTSIYAGLHALGVPQNVALAVQCLAAVGVLVAVVAVARSGMPVRMQLGVSVLACPFVTPYVYDYDGAVMGVALALLMPALARSMSQGEQLAVLLLTFLGGAGGLIQHTRFLALQPAGVERGDMVSPGFVALLAAAALIAVVLRREPAADVGSAPALSAPRAA